MIKKTKEMWIRALKSGEFKQGKGYLERDGKYCALGVLSLLSLIEGQCTYNQIDGVGKFDNKDQALWYFSTRKQMNAMDFLKVFYIIKLDD